MPNIREQFYRHLGQTSEFPMELEVSHAKGLYIFDPDGKSYLDLISGIGVSGLGHSHPNILNAIHAQVDRHLHVMVYGEFIQQPQVKLATAISKTLPDSLNSVFLVNSGSEATEGALKLAKRHTGRSEIISCKNAYHGSTNGALSVGGNESLKQAYRPLLPNVKHIEFGDPNALEIISEKTAAVLIETVQGEAGVRTANSDYFKKLRSLCDEYGTLLIFDEIQCGFGRTGKFWAFEHYEIAPDILLAAKGMGGGMPIGAFISSNEIMSGLTHNPILGHITTFGGHPVSAAAALATLETIVQDDLVSTVSEKSDLFQELLVHDKIEEVRAVGLMMAVQLESFDITKAVIDQLIELGVISDWFLFCDNSIRIAPPLIIQKEEIKMACSKILQAIDFVYDN